MDLEPLLARDQQAGRGVEPSGEQDDRLAAHRPGTSPQRTLWSWRPRRIGRPQSRTHAGQIGGRQRLPGRRERHDVAAVQIARRTNSSAQSKSRRSASTNFNSSCGRQALEILRQVGVLHAASRRLDVHDLDDARIDPVERRRGLPSRGAPSARFQQAVHQGIHAVLLERLAARDLDEVGAEGEHALGPPRRPSSRRRRGRRRRCRTRRNAARSPSAGRTRRAGRRASTLPGST